MIFIKKIDKILLVSTCILIIFGIIMVYSSSNIWSEYKYNDPYKYVKSQFIFFCLGLIVIYIITKLPPSILEKYSNHISLFAKIKDARFHNEISNIQINVVNLNSDSVWEPLFNAIYKLSSGGVN